MWISEITRSNASFAPRLRSGATRRRRWRVGHAVPEQRQQRFGAGRDFAVVLDEQHAARRASPPRIVHDRRRPRRHPRRVRAADRGAPTCRRRPRCRSSRGRPSVRRTRTPAAGRARPHPCAFVVNSGSNARAHVGRHARTRVIERDLHEIAGERKTVLATQCHVARADGEAAPVVIASRALTARLITASSSPRRRRGSDTGSIATTSDDFEPSDVFSSSRHVPTHCPTSIVSLCSGCLRATPRSWRVSDCRSSARARSRRVPCRDAGPRAAARSARCSR